MLKRFIPQTVPLRNGSYFVGLQFRGAWYLYHSNIYFATVSELEGLMDDKRNSGKYLSWKLYKLTTGRSIYLPYWKNMPLVWKPIKRP